jgi:hypothetical protein
MSRSMFETLNSNQFEYLKTNQSDFDNAKCVQSHLVIFFLNSNWYLLLSGRVLSFFLVAFFYLGLTKADEFLMISIEKITSNKVKSLFENVETKSLVWSNSFADLTLRALGSNSFEIICPLVQLPFNIYEQSTEPSIEFNVLIVIHIIFPHLSANRTTSLILFLFKQ